MINSLINFDYRMIDALQLMTYSDFHIDFDFDLDSLGLDALLFIGFGFG